uniref:carboxypeptidase-like regulatory domain-containing protein n=1 Tax=uncultured Bacteroides sp. TaxID=162156 RepID=UPI0025966556
MKAIKTFLLTSLMVFLPVILSAQTVSGKLVDEKNQPLSYANVVLLSLPDSAFVSGTISGEDGSFTLEATSKNQIVRISSIGYNTVYKSTRPTDMGVVRLQWNTTQLGEVVVKGDLPKTRIKDDALVTTIQNSP